MTIKKTIKKGKAQSAGPSEDPNKIKAEDIMLTKPIAGTGTHLGIKINLN
jgi:hypothetical protein